MFFWEVLGSGFSEVESKIVKGIYKDKEDPEELRVKMGIPFRTFSRYRKNITTKMQEINWHKKD